MPTTKRAEIQPPQETTERPTINEHHVTDDRYVFTEDGNTDGWIATNTTLTVTQ